jgi:two-component system, cell cycle sensor histidine kinase and response regulator CckA
MAVPAAFPAENPEPARVLVLHSYHHGFDWTDDVQRGIERTLDAAQTPVETAVEYMDTKRHAGVALFERLAEIYAVKYDHWQPDVIVSCDDDALHFLFEYRDRLFPAIPVVFCGLDVDHYDPAMLEGHKNYTGVVERLDMQSTIDLIRQIQPEVRKVCFIHDRTTSGLAHRALIESFTPGFQDHFEFHYFDTGKGLSENELLTALKGLAPDSAVIFLAFSRDRNEKPLALSYILPRICAVSPVPVYSHAEFYFGHGILGGKLLCGEVHGESAGKKAVQLLEGKTAADVPVSVESSSRYMFDQRQLDRFGIGARLLPAGSIVAFGVFSILQEYRRELIWAGAGILLLLLFIAVLLVDRARRRALERRLAVSEAKYRAFFEKNQAVQMLIDPENGHILEANPAAIAFYGYSPRQFASMSIFQINIADRAYVKAEMARAYKEKQGIFHFQHRLSGGELRAVEVHSSPIKINGHHYLHSIIHDITERKKAAEALGESEAKYRRLVEGSPDIVYIYSESAGARFWSQRIHDILGYEPEAFVEAPFRWRQAIHPEDRAIARQAIAGCREGRKFDIEYRIQDSHGKWHWFRDRSISSYTEEDETIIEGLASDITDRKHAEAVFQETQLILAEAERLAGMGAWSHDVQAETWTFSRNWLAIHGCRAAPAGREELMRIAWPEDIPRIEAAFEKTFSGKEPYEIEHRIVRADTGEIRTIQAFGELVRDQKGNPLRMTGAVLDITDRKQMEEEVAAARRHESLATMAGAIAHNFNNILMGVIGNLDFALMDSRKEAPERQYIANAKNATRRAIELSRLMLLYVGQGRERTATFSLARVLRDNEEQLRETAGGNAELICEIEGEGDAFSVSGDSLQLLEAVQKLVANASEALPETGGTIRIRLRRAHLAEEEKGLVFVPEKPVPGSYICLTVADTGQGMNPETIRHIFEPYFTTKFIGRGLGLAAVLGIVRGHDGAIRVESREGEGAAFCLCFPAAADAKPDAEAGGRR